jgi:hypothetical protein
MSDQGPYSDFFRALFSLSLYQCLAGPHDHSAFMITDSFRYFVCPPD